MRRLAIVMAAALLAGCANEATKMPAPTTGKPVKPVNVTSPATQPARPVATADGKSVTLIANRNALIHFHSSEVDYNAGGVHRLRAATIVDENADVAIVDFDRFAIKAFLDANKGKTVTGTLMLSVRELDQNKPGKIEVASLDSGNDWNQGKGMSEEEAAKGEVTASAAQFGVKPWTTPDGKKAAGLRQLIFGSGTDVKTLLNSGSVTVTKPDKEKDVEIALDAAFLAHLATDPNCRGIVIFTRSDGAKISMSSRDKEGHEPRIVLAVK